MVTDMKRSASFPFEKRTGKGLRKLRAIRRTPRPGAADVGSQDGGYPGRYPIQIKRDKQSYRNVALSSQERKATFRYEVPAQPVDATPFNRLIRQYFP